MIKKKTLFSLDMYKKKRIFAKVLPKSATTTTFLQVTISRQPLTNVNDTRTRCGSAIVEDCMEDKRTTAVSQTEGLVSIGYFFKVPLSP